MRFSTKKIGISINVSIPELFSYFKIYEIISTKWSLKLFLNTDYIINHVFYLEMIIIERDLDKKHGQHEHQIILSGTECPFKIFYEAVYAFYQENSSIFIIKNEYIKIAPEHINHKFLIELEMTVPFDMIMYLSKKIYEYNIQLYEQDVLLEYPSLTDVERDLNLYKQSLFLPY